MMGGLPPVEAPAPASHTSLAAISYSTAAETAGRLNPSALASAARDCEPCSRSSKRMFLALPDIFHAVVNFSNIR